jgi:hypothetical protein
MFMLNFFRREIVPFERGEAYVLPPVVQQIEVENTALLLLTGVLMNTKTTSQLWRRISS